MQHILYITDLLVRISGKSGRIF